MTYEVVLESLQSSFNWLFSVFFPRIFSFLKNNELVSAALIIALVLPAVFVIIDFFINASSDAELYTSKLIKKKVNKSKNDELAECRKNEISKLRQQGYQGRNSYYQAYLNSLKYDKK